MTKLFLLAVFSAGAAFAQCGAYTNFSTLTGSANLSSAMNGKLNVQCGTADPNTASIAGTAGIDAYVNTATGDMFACRVTGTPCTWVPVDPNAIGYCFGKSYVASGSITAYTGVVVGAGGTVSTAGSGGGGWTGVAQSNVSNGQAVLVCSVGPSSLVMDSTSTAGDLAISSVSTGGYGHDSAQSSRNNVGLQVGMPGTVTAACSGSPCTATVILEGPNAHGRQILAVYVPTLNQSTTGNAGTANALAALPTPCGAGLVPLGILANGNSTGCFTPSGAANITVSHSFTGTQELAFTHNLNTLNPVVTCYNASSPFTAVSAAINVTTPGTVNTTYVTATSTTLACTFNASGVTGAAGPTGATGSTGANGTNGAISAIQANGTAQTVRPNLNLKSGTGSTVSCADNSGASSTDCTVSSSGGSAISAGAFASVPSCTSSTFMYQATDSPYYALCNGSSSLQWYFQSNAQTPATSLSWSWFNQSSSTIATVGGAQMLTGTATGTGNNVQGRTITIPSTPYSVTACFDFPLAPTAYYQGGIFLTDGSKAITFGDEYGISPFWVLSAATYSTATTFNGGYLSSVQFQGLPSGCMTISDNGTTRKFWISGQAGGRMAGSRILVGSVAHNDYLTPTSIGFYVNSAASSLAPQFILYTFTSIAETI